MMGTGDTALINRQGAMQIVAKLPISRDSALKMLDDAKELVIWLHRASPDEEGAQEGRASAA